MAPSLPILAFLVGDHGQGKSTACRLLAERGRAMGLSVGGIIQPAVYQADGCIGYDVVDLASGRSARLATIGGGGVEHMGRFHFLLEGLEFGKAAIQRAAQGSPQLVIIDEVGPLELAGRGWSVELDELLQSRAGGPSAGLRGDGGAFESSARTIRWPTRFMLWSARRTLAAQIEARWSTNRDPTARCEAPGRYDLSGGPDAIVSDIIMALGRGVT